MPRDTALQPDALSAAIKATDHLAYALVNIRANVGVITAMAPLKPDDRPDPLLTPSASDVPSHPRALQSASIGKVNGADR